MKLLVLGGTAFLGRCFVETALAAGHELTLFNRGKRAPDLFPQVEQVRGDRGEDLSALRERTWDAVFDTSGYYPRVVGMSADLLAGSVGRYLFVSSISVLKNMDLPNQDEDAELAEADGPIAEEITGETYGPLKVQCEHEVLTRFGSRALIVRPGLIVGRYDFTDRFTYWPMRMRRGGDVLVPDLKDQPVQIIDVRDLCEWCLRLLEREAEGTYFATGPAEPFSLGDFLTACAEGTNANLVWTSAELLQANEVQPWSELPLVVGLDGSGRGMLQVNVDRAVAAGLTFRPLQATIQDTVLWADTRSPDYSWRAGLSAQREHELLQKEMLQK